MPLILHHLEPWHWALAGAGIGAITLVMIFVLNRRLGISAGFEDLCSLVLRGPYFERPSLFAARPWRLPFVVGLVMGGAASALFSGGWQMTMDLGMFDERIGFGPGGKMAWMFVAGLLIGFGTRLAGGCTSGHGIFGLSNLEWPSLVTTVAFMTAGVGIWRSARSSASCSAARAPLTTTTSRACSCSRASSSTASSAPRWRSARRDSG
jgi:uncharacterized membrane protein YedE/YeeE